jgi:hypothetical protein
MLLDQSFLFRTQSSKTDHYWLRYNNFIFSSHDSAKLTVLVLCKSIPQNQSSPVFKTPTVSMRLLECRIVRMRNVEREEQFIVSTADPRRGHDDHERQISKVIHATSQVSHATSPLYSVSSMFLLPVVQLCLKRQSTASRASGRDSRFMNVVKT